MAKGERIKKEFKHPKNSNRGKAKKIRGRGKLAMGKMSSNDWAKKFDLLFGIKGIERYKLIKRI